MPLICRLEMPVVFFFFFNDTATTEIYTLSYTTLFRSAVRAASRPRRARSPLARRAATRRPRDRKSTRLNSSHITISYVVFCLKKKKQAKDFEPFDEPKPISLLIQTDPWAMVICADTPRIAIYFFFNDTATTEIYTLSLHDALPIFHSESKIGLSNRPRAHADPHQRRRDRKSTRLNSSHITISYAVFCLKKKKNIKLTLIVQRKTNKLKQHIS